MARARKASATPVAGQNEGERASPALRAAIYCRKSNDDRKSMDDVSLTVKAQELDCKKVVEREGWTLVAIHADDGISGRTWASGKDYDALAESDTVTKEYVKNMAKKRRPGLGALLDSVRRREIDVIVVRDMPRLARPVFQSSLANFLPSFIQSNKVRIYSLADGMIDYSDFHKSLALFLAEALLDKELKTRAKHSKEAKKREWAKGRFIASRIPFGYIRDTAGKLVHHPENAAIIKRFFERCAQGVPITTMVKEYNASKGKGPDGTSLHIESLRWMLRNPVYCGKLYVDGRLIKCIDIDEPIISEQLYHKAVKLYESRKRIVSNRAKSSGGLASGIIRCGLCGYAMIHWHSSYGPAYRKYMCGVRSSTGCKCAINANNLDGFINCFTPLKGIIEHRQIGIDAEEKKQLPELREREGLLNDKIDKYMDRIESEDVAVFADVFKRLKTELIKVQQRIVDLENIPDTPVKKEMVAVFDQEFEGLSIDEKRLALRSVIKTIVVFPDKVTFTLASDESFGVDRMDMGGRRIWLPPVHIRRMNTGEHLRIVIEQGIDETKTLLDGRLLLVKSSTLHLDEGVEENRSTYTRRKRAIAFMRAQLRK